MNIFHIIYEKYESSHFLYLQLVFDDPNLLQETDAQNSKNESWAFITSTVSQSLEEVVKVGDRYDLCAAEKQTAQFEIIKKLHGKTQKFVRQQIETAWRNPQHLNFPFEG